MQQDTKRAIHNSEISLKEYFETTLRQLENLMDSKFVRHGEMLKAQADRVALAFDASQAAIRKAEEQTDKRLALLNEFRGQAEDESAKFVRSDSWDAMNISINDKIASLERWQSKIVGALALIVFVMPAVIFFVARNPALIH